MTELAAKLLDFTAESLDVMVVVGTGVLAVAVAVPAHHHSHAQIHSTGARGAGQQDKQPLHRLLRSLTACRSIGARGAGGHPGRFRSCPDTATAPGTAGGHG